MSNVYTDKWQRLHHKPTDGVNPSSNNGFIYTAYFYKINNIHPSLQSTPELIEAGEQCAKYRARHPRPHISEQVPISRDEILGLEYLGFNVDMDGWNFSPYPLPKFSLLQFIKQAQSLIIVQPYYKRVLGVDIKLYHFELAHRNFFWKNNLSQIYHLAFSVPLQDRYSILKWSGLFKWYLPSHLLYASISMVDRLGKPSGIRYLKYGGEKNMRAMITEFPADHDIVKAVRERLR